MLAFFPRLVPYRRLAVVIAHLALVAIAYLAAFSLRFEFSLERAEWGLFLHSLAVLVVVRSFTFAWFHLYDSLWRYVSMRDIVVILKAVTTSSVAFAWSVEVIFRRKFRSSILLLDFVLCLAAIGGVRLALRAFRESFWRSTETAARRALIVGAGDAGEMLIREIGRSATVNYDVVGFIDDDYAKLGRRIHGVEVLGTVDAISDLCRSRKVQDVLVAVPSAGADLRQRILARCRESGVTSKTVPTLKELLQGRARIGQLQEVRPEDLLGREAVRLDAETLRRELQGKRILVTGGAGFLGAEVFRPIAAV